MTFSIVAHSPGGELGPEWGVAVASKFLAAGSVVPWGQAGAGAVATQAFANLAYGPEGLALLDEPLDADAVVERLTSSDEGRADRQLGVVDADGRAATFTGEKCFDWAGGRTGPGYCCQGNILAGPGVVDSMAAAYEDFAGDFEHKLLAALSAGDEAGGDKRGRQSAALMVWRAGGSYGGAIDRAVDLRVDDHPDPVRELKRLFDLHRLYFPRRDELDFFPVDDKLEAELLWRLREIGYETKAGWRAALFEYVGTENLEERWKEADEIERGILGHLRNRG